MKCLMLLADGFEEIEALTQRDYLNRAGLEVDLVTIDKEVVKGAHGICVVTEKKLDDVALKDYSGIIIPGGADGVENLIKNQEVIEQLKEADNMGLLIAAICAGPYVLDQAGILKDNKYTCFPGFEEKISSGLHRKEGVVLSRHLITAAGVGYAQEFAFSIIEYLLGEKKKRKIQQEVLYQKYE